MMLKLLFFLVLASQVTPQSLVSRLFDATSRSRNVAQFIADALQEVINGPQSQTLRALRQQNRLQDVVPPDVSFPCETEGSRSPIPPTSVHRLRPGDIDIVGAIGDSLSSGTGAAAKNLLQLAVENRGLSFTGGGQGTWRQFLTIPNILKEFNPKLFGFATGDGFWHNLNSQFNVAFIGATDQDLLFQAKYLVKRMKADKRVDMKRHWKLVTIMTGDNNFCTDMCYNKAVDTSPERHKEHLQETLDYLQENLPRTFINLINLPNILMLKDLSDRPTHCQYLKHGLCSCLFNLDSEKRFQILKNVLKRYNNAEADLMNSDRYNVKEDFAVVVQPFAINATKPLKETKSGNVTDFSIFSHDCFHFSQKGYAKGANSVWNNMLEPVGLKSGGDWTNLFSRFLCPTQETPYLFTAKNSKRFLETGRQ